MAKEEKKVLTPEQQIAAYLEANKGNHYNFYEKVSYKVPSGSLKFDIELGGGIRPGIVRMCGVTEGGKTSCSLAFARNFQKLENSMVIYIQAERTVSEEILLRSGVDQDPSKWFIYKSNVYESVVGLIRNLIKNNPTKKKYLFILDSMDALVPEGDIDKAPGEANKVSGGALLSADFLRKMSIVMSTLGHICVMISQVRTAVKINQYEKTDPKVTNASGGNALLHYPDWIFEFQERTRKDEKIWSGEAGKSDPIGHWCEIIFRKSVNEKSGKSVRYPIKYNRINGKSIWLEYEIADLMLAWGHITVKGSWYILDETLAAELAKENIPAFDKLQGLVALREHLEGNEKLVEYLYNKYSETLRANI